MAVSVKGEVGGEQIEKLKRGIWLAEGKTNRASVKILKRSHKESLVEVTIREGLNRQIRRMFAKVRLKVKSLKGMKIGNISVKGLGIGKFRKLNESELASLRKIT